MPAHIRRLGPAVFYREVLNIALPVMLQQLIMSMVSLIDNFMVAGLGDISMAAVNVANQINFVFIVMINTICGAGGIYLAQFRGANDTEGMRHAYRFKVIFALTAALVYFMLCWTIADRMIALMTMGNAAQKEIVILGSRYLRLCSFTLVPMVICFSIGSSFREMGMPKIPLFISAAATAVNTLGRHRHGDVGGCFGEHPPLCARRFYPGFLYAPGAGFHVCHFKTFRRCQVSGGPASFQKGTVGEKFNPGDWFPMRHLMMPGRPSLTRTGSGAKFFNRGYIMDRREFLKKTAAAGFGAGLFFLPRGLRRSIELVAQENSYPDMVALKGGLPETMFSRGIQLIGGMGRFVKRGQTVVVKPNMSFDVGPNYGANTSPALVAAVVKQCLDAGARRVLILDHSIESWERTGRSSGILEAARNAGAVHAPAEQERYYQRVEINGRRLKETKIHESLLENDVLINVPVLKHHGGAVMSASIKNLMGCVWNRNAYHSSLNASIADFLRAKKPDLNIVDAYRVVTRNGPRGGRLEDVAQMGSLLMSTDIVAVDTAASALLGHRQGAIEYIRLASEAGFGQMDLSKLNISRITV